METRNILILLFVFVISCSPYHGQSQLLYPIVGTYKKHSAQGMAIWKDKAFLFNDGGGCRVLNLKTGVVEREFSLASSGKNTHVNTACFGSKKTEGDSLPLLYVSETRSPYRCFVESIGGTIPSLVQTITPMRNGKPMKVTNWVVDRTKKVLYSIARVKSGKRKNSDRVLISKYRLPTKDEGNNIILSEKDCLDSFSVRFKSALQGSSINDNYIFIASGFSEMSEKKYYSERAIQIVDLKTKKLVEKIDLTYITTNEPEGIDFYEGSALLYTGQNGGIYKIKID